MFPKISEVTDMISRKEISMLSGKQKQAYKWTLCALIINILKGKNMQHGQIQNFKIAKRIHKIPRKIGITDTDLKFLRDQVINSLKINNFKKPYSEETPDRLISFLREILKDMTKSNRTMIPAYEVDNIFDIEKTYHPLGMAVRKFHWFDFDFNRGLIPTYPTLIIFSDLKIHWNTYVEKYLSLIERDSKIIHAFERTAFETNEKTREERISLSGLQRTLLFTAVTFVESYLFDIFYNMNEIEFPNKRKFQNILRNKKINDKQIIEDILFKLETNLPERISDSYTLHKELIKIRDSYVHVSQFADNNGTTRMQNIMYFTHSQLAQYLNNSIQMVLNIEDSLPSELHLLFWWSWYEGEIDFNNLTKISLLNKNSAIASLDYYQ
ncbi:MAG: hypothetical protein ACQEXX_18530 [Bacillota bacterium]